MISQLQAIPFILLVMYVSWPEKSPIADLKEIPHSTLYWHSHLSELNFKLAVETPFKLSFVGMVLPLNESTGIIVFGRNDGIGLSSVEFRVCSGVCVVQGFPSEENSLQAGNLVDSFSGVYVFFYDTHTILEFTWDFRKIFSEYDWEISPPEMKIFLIDSDGQPHEKIYPLVLQTDSETVPYTPINDTKQEKTSDKWHVLGHQWNLAVGGEWLKISKRNAVLTSSLDSLGYTMTQNLINGSLDLYWQPVIASDTSISFALVGQATGWIGVGFSQSGYMVVSDAIVGYVDKTGKATVNAYQLKQYAEPQGVHPNLKLWGISGTQVDGTTTLFFTRNFSSGNVPVVAAGWNLMIAAFQSDNEIDFVYHGSTRQPDLWIEFSIPPPPDTTSPLPTTPNSNTTATIPPLSPITVTIPPPNSPTTPTTTPPFDGNTLQEQGYTFLQDIISGKLTLYWKPISPSDTTISFALVGNNVYGYIAVGWSPDGGMVGSDAVIGWVQNNESTIQSYYLQQEEVPTSPHPNLPLQDTAGTEISGDTTIFFVRDFSSGYNPISKNGFTNVIGAYQLQNQDALMYHGLQSRSAIKIDFATGVATVSLRPFGAEDVHALLMFLSWGLILPLGMLWARYARNLQNDLWFKVHRVSQYSGIVIALVGITVIFATTQQHYTTVYHGQLGTLVMVLAVVQAVGAWFRPHKDPLEAVSLQRQVFEYFHWWNGRILVVLGVVQMFSGVIQIGYPPWVAIVYGCVVAGVLVAVVVREVQNCFWPKEKEKIKKTLEVA